MEEGGEKEVETQELELDLRSQRVSDTYPVRQRIVEKRKSIVSRVFERITSSFLNVLIRILFPKVLENSPLSGVLFSKTTSVKLLCPHTCAEGHICSYTEGHSGEHVCVFGHVGKQKVPKCGSTCDCRGCDAECVFSPGHSGCHKCHFRHYPSDIPASAAEAKSFRDDKAVGDYIDELAYSTAEDMKYAYIPETLDPSEELWTQN